MRLKKHYLISFSGSALFIFVLCGMMKLCSAPPSMKRDTVLKTSQTKSGVIKELYLTQPDGTFLHEYLSAKNSVFKLVKDQKKADFVEDLDGISAVFEEIVAQNGKSVKHIRSLQAQNGTWYYSGSQLIAQKAQLSIVETQKSGLKPLFQGQAEKLDLKIQNGKPQFKIEGFKAKLQKDKS